MHATSLQLKAEFVAIIFCVVGQIVSMLGPGARDVLHTSEAVAVQPINTIDAWLCLVVHTATDNQEMLKRLVVMYVKHQSHVCSTAMMSHAYPASLCLPCSGTSHCSCFVLLKVLDMERVDPH